MKGDTQFMRNDSLLTLGLKLSASRTKRMCLSGQDLGSPRGHTPKVGVTGARGGIAAVSAISREASFCSESTRNGAPPMRSSRSSIRDTTPGRGHASSSTFSCAGEYFGR